ncbi:MAG: TetR/AcrR family transcriptional regulator [Solirubrobacteraceae bacterium]
MQAASSTPESPDPVLAAADRLFYRRGVQAVGMDALREEAGVSLRRMYRLYPSKDALVEAYLHRRDERWRRWLRTRVEERCAQPAERPLAVFDALDEWFAGDDFRGCALVNASAELGETTPAVRRQAECHKAAVRAYIAELLGEAGHPGDAEDMAAELMLLIDGATVQASVGADADAAQRAKAMGERLLACQKS